MADNTTFKCFQLVELGHPSVPQFSPGSARVPEVIKGRVGESREKGIQGARGESRTKNGILPCSVIIIFFVNISTIKT